MTTEKSLRHIKTLLSPAPSLIDCPERGQVNQSVDSCFFENAIFFQILSSRMIECATDRMVIGMFTMQTLLPQVMPRLIFRSHWG